MSRTSISMQSLSQNAGTAVTETTLAAGSTGTSGYALTSAGRDTDTVIVIRNNGSATGVFTIKEGDYCNDSQGDLDVTVGVNVVKAIQLDGARFRTSDGYYNVDAGTTGVIYAVK